MGIVRDPLGGVLGSQEAKTVCLVAGPAMWLRVTPSSDSGRRWRINELEKYLPLLTPVPLVKNRGSGRFVRGEDGCGYYPVIRDDGWTYSVCYVFETGEVWIINASAYLTPGFIDFNESDFTESLDVCATFLDRLGYAKPYWWQAGMEDIRNHSITVPGRFNSSGQGPCLVKVFEEEGFYKEGDTAAGVLLPFFEKVYDKFGGQR